MRGGFKKTKVAVAHKLTTVLHVMWKTGDAFRCMRAPAMLVTANTTLAGSTYPTPCWSGITFDFEENHEPGRRYSHASL